MKTNGVLTQAETHFFRAISAAAQPLLIFPKVNLGDLVAPSPSLPPSESTSARNKISKKHVDFVVIDNQTCEVLCAIELDDASHQSERARKRDADKDHALKSAGLPLLRVPVARNYEVAVLKTKLAALLSPQAESA